MKEAQDREESWECSLLHGSTGDWLAAAGAEGGATSLHLELRPHPKTHLDPWRRCPKVLSLHTTEEVRFIELYEL